MSLKTEGVTCSMCHAYLFQEDDIVYCPICGAPHHRECYNEIGHCALEALHGTEKQYDKLKERSEKDEKQDSHKQSNEFEGQISCGMCHEKYDFSLNACPRCGAPNIAKAGGSFVSFDFLGGVPADYDIGETVTADEAKRLVAVNTRRYIPKFAVLNRKNRVSWNWAAFLFPCEWMLSRKMFKGGIFAGIISVISTLMYYPLSKSVNNLATDSVKNYLDLAQLIAENIPKIGSAVIIALFIGFAISLALRIFCGMFGDYIYKNHTIESIKKIRAESEDMDADYRKKGGVNLIWFLVGTIALQYLPSIIAAFF